MAPLKVRKPAAVLFDLVATATKSFFIDQILFPYIKQNAKRYLVENWDNQVVQNDVTLLRKAAAKDKTAPKVAGPEEEAKVIQTTTVSYIFYCLDKKKDNEGMTLFRFHVIFDGYAKGHLKTPLYTDVAVQMHHWVVEDKVKLYLFSNGWKEATKRYLASTSQGDMNLLISDHFDTEEGQLSDPNTFKKIVAKIKQAPEDVLFLTHCAAEAMAAKKAGLGAILIMTHRRDVNKLLPEEKKELPYVRSFNEIIFTGDAPKASNLNGSSVVDDEADEGKSESVKKKSKTSSVKSGNKKKSKSKSSSLKNEKKKTKSKSNASRSSSESGSQTNTKVNTGGGINEPKVNIEFKFAKLGLGDGSKSKTKSLSSNKSNKSRKSSSSGKSGPKTEGSFASNKSTSSKVGSGSKKTSSGTAKENLNAVASGSKTNSSNSPSSSKSTAVVDNGKSGPECKTSSDSKSNNKQ